MSMCSEAFLMTLRKMMACGFAFALSLPLYAQEPANEPAQIRLSDSQIELFYNGQTILKGNVSTQRAEPDGNTTLPPPDRWVFGVLRYCG